MERAFYVRYNDIADLVKYALASPQVILGGQATLNHVEAEGKHIYFVYAGGLQGILVSYVEVKDPVAKKYVIFNRINGRLSFSDSPATQPQSISIPILEVAETNVFQALGRKRSATRI